MLGELHTVFSGELYYDDSAAHHAVRMSYATDASVYQEKPAGVAIPKTVEDIKVLVQFAGRNKVAIIPRAAGTSLAGQVVGNGIVVDISKHFTSILEVNEEEQWVSVQPGVIRDDLNAHLKPYGLMFGPETSTASRAMIGGMIGNNASGLHSIVWGDTRQNLLEVKAILSDGSEVVFRELTKHELNAKCNLQSLEGKIYRELKTLLSQQENKEAIETGFPKKSISRRNTGYALDMLLSGLEKIGELPFNLCQLIAGSEGTLCFLTEARLRLRKLPPREQCIVAVHTTTTRESLLANIEALKHHCAASELVDDIILNYTKTNIEQSKNRFFVEGEPKAILMVEFFDEDKASLQQKAASFIQTLKSKNLGYTYPVLYGGDTSFAWDLRKGGLGLLRNEPGDTQPVNLIEDCAVSPDDLPHYIERLEALLRKYSIKYSMYAHAGAGELHMEPMINLKTLAGKHLFRTVLQETAALVKSYNGSLSGEHGDGRLRGEFIPYMMGKNNYDLFKQVKEIFDPQHIFNRGKIVDTPPMNEFLRYQQDMEKKDVATVFDFSRQEGILHLAEKCSGSGDCRKTHITGGTMCPSYMATRSEWDTTRARANMLRHFYNGKAYENTTTVNEEEVLKVLDLCLSCKACKSECPSSVDVGKMKAEFMQAFYDRHGVPARAKLVAGFNSNMKLAAHAPRVYNFVFKTPALRKLANKAVGFHPDRTMPLLQTTTLRAWWKQQEKKMLGDSRHTTPTSGLHRQVYIFCDEFTNFNDVETGQKMILLLQSLGYEVHLPAHAESGRTWLSKGLVRKARELAIENVKHLSALVSKEVPLIGIEPSAILTLRDEYPELVPAQLLPATRSLAANTFLFEEWFAKEIETGNINPLQFEEKQRKVYVHGHCHQKALSSTAFIKRSLAIVPGYEVDEIPSGCCGMAGSFGYEKEHYDVSMQIGELVLFPTVRRLEENILIAASGTSCRHQIHDGTGRKSKHSAEILYDALKKI